MKKANLLFIPTAQQRCCRWHVSPPAMPTATHPSVGGVANPHLCKMCMLCREEPLVEGGKQYKRSTNPVNTSCITPYMMSENPPRAQLYKRPVCALGYSFTVQTGDSKLKQGRQLTVMTHSFMYLLSRFN